MFSSASNPQVLYVEAKDGGVFKRGRPKVWNPKSDVADDGHVSITDVLLLIDFHVGSVRPTSGQFRATDLNDDGTLDKVMLS
ncbi:MAG: hypothetical protein JSV84_14135 [Gemmatimonadota bacterium]|nr:MAG: hypothetical protein JSV84_14135 [Gemmatimonadota bacterium]